MHRARVEAVDGRRVLANGRWHISIGNMGVSVGDLVWTDGRCIYGHESEGVAPAVIMGEAEPYVPVLLSYSRRCLYHNGGLRKGPTGGGHALMASLEDAFTFSDHWEPRAIDIAIDSAGNGTELLYEEYVHSNGSIGFAYHLDTATGKAWLGGYEERTFPDEYWRDGSKVKREALEYIQLLQDCSHRVGILAKQELAKESVPASVGVLDVTVDEQARILGGWMESVESYCILFEGNGRAVRSMGKNLQRKRFDSDRFGPDYIWMAEEDTFSIIAIEYQIRIMATPQGMTLLSGRYRRSKSVSIGTWVPFKGEEPCRYVNFAESAEIPLPDGISVAMKRKNDNLENENGAQGYDCMLLSKAGEEICLVPEYTPGMRVIACQLTRRKWLVSIDGTLYRIKNGVREQIGKSSECRNTRLRPMQDYSKWMANEA